MIRKSLKPKKVRITVKQKRFVEGKLAGKSSRKAALDAGYTENVADNANKLILGHVGTEAYINKLGAKLEDLGVDDDLLALKIKEGLNSVKQKPASLGIKLMKGEVENIGAVDNYDIDYRTRLDYIKYAGELKGHNINKKSELPEGAAELVLIEALNRLVKSREKQV